MGAGRGVIALVAAALLMSACRGDADDAATKITPSTTEPTTTTTVATLVAGEVLVATTSPPQTTATTRVESSGGATVNDAPRDAHPERTDNTGSLTYGATPGGTSGVVAQPNDPLEFTIGCQVAADGHGKCGLALINHVTRSAQFPGGLRIVITMQRKGGGASDFEHFLPHVTTLRPGEKAEVDATFDLTEHGEYDYFATTTVAWP